MSKGKSAITRREFIGKTAAGIAAVSSYGLTQSCNSSVKKLVPTRVLGKTGLNVSLLSFGGGSRFLRANDGLWEPLLERAIELGINLFDTSPDYDRKGSLTSEERFAEILPKYRKKVHIITKFNERTADNIKKSIEESLKKLKTDYIDIYMLHALKEDDDLAIFEHDGYKAMLELKEQGVVNYIGFSDMNSAENGKAFVEKLDFDVVLMPLNPTTFGGFKEILLPPCQDKNIGVISMKLFRNVFDKGIATAEELFEYAISPKGVASALVAQDKIEDLEQNAQIVKNIEQSKSPKSDLNELESRMAHLAGPHVLEWARPDYVDGGIV